MIHETAVISSEAEIPEDISVGPYVVIEGNVKIGKGARIDAHACVYSGTEIGEGCHLHAGCVLGGDPQDIRFEGKPTFLKIGKRNIFREYCTVHRGAPPGSATTVGDDNYIMTYVHIAHNCEIGNRVIVATGSMLGGYVVVEDEVFISGNAAVHQFARIGRLSMVGGNSRVNKDLPPFMLLRGDDAVRSLNTVGLRRSALSEDAKRSIKEAYKILYRSNLNTAQAIEKLSGLSPSEELRYLIDFIRSSKRGICQGWRKAGTGFAEEAA